MVQLSAMKDIASIARGESVMDILRKTLIAGVALATLGASVATTTAPASAKPFGFGHGFGFHHGFFHNHGFGFIGAGALLGAAATTPYWGSYYGCYIARQPIVNAYGDVIGVRPVRVCD
jgi:hypothetical protein